MYLLELTGTVGSNTFSASTVRRRLNEAAGRPVDILIDSPGGYLSEGLSISGALRDHGEVTAHLRGLVASAATIASMGAKKISMAPEALYLVHKVSLTFLDWASRNSDQLSQFIEELNHTKDNLDQMDKAVAGVYAARCKRPVKDLLELMKGEKWLSAQEALDWGFIDEIQNFQPSQESQSSQTSQTSKFSNDSKLTITQAQANAITALGLPLPDLEIIPEASESQPGTIPVSIPDRETSFFNRLLHNIINPITDAIKSLRNMPEQQNQTQPQTSEQTTEQTAQNSHESTQPQQSTQDLQARIRELEAQLAARPAATTTVVNAAPTTSKEEKKSKPANAFERYLRTSASAQALYDSLP
ncbi:MAG: ATP-dependent Clp protease proteolytic subunit [Muribaculaceae bacterium]|nr:ATP-dependent Clp protease proteolytic subunit [Muribaculaceae bacterium]